MRQHRKNGREVNGEQVELEERKGLAGTYRQPCQHVTYHTECVKKPTTWSTLLHEQGLVEVKWYHLLPSFRRVVCSKHQATSTVGGCTEYLLNKQGMEPKATSPFYLATE